MLVVSFFQWWYGRGFREYLERFLDRLKDAVDFFSIRLLIRNLFAPFKQIATEDKGIQPLNIRIRAWFDLLVSRCVGATIRFGLLVMGTIVLILRAVIGIILAIAWPLMPLIVIALVVLYMRGFVI